MPALPALVIGGRACLRSLPWKRWYSADLCFAASKQRNGVPHAHLSRYFSPWFWCSISERNRTLEANRERASGRLAGHLPARRASRAGPNGGTEVWVWYATTTICVADSPQGLYARPPAQSRAGVLTETRFFNGSLLFAASHFGGRPLRGSCFRAIPSMATIASTRRSRCSRRSASALWMSIKEVFLAQER